MVVANFWTMFSVPPAGILITTVIIVNLGGVYNCIAYTVIRRRLQRQNATSSAQIIFKSGSEPATFADSGRDNQGHSLSAELSNQQTRV
jgi:hypothetical protein